MGSEKILVLYSGGKDSSLVSYMLTKLSFKVKLLTVNFGVIPDSYKSAEKAAQALGFEFEKFKLDKEIVEKATDIAEEDGFPLNAINFTHKKVLEEVCSTLAKDFPIIADGARRDDKTPKLSFAEMQSLEDRFSVQYLTPLRGISYKTVNYLTDKLFKIEIIKAGTKQTAEYETEIRALLRERGGSELEKKIFPAEHTQTIVLGWKNEQK